jgi:hypothetical protein
MSATANEQDQRTGFIQVMHGQVSDRDELRSMVDQWMAELAPGATGWLGSTGGVTDEGRFMTLVRFATPEDARRNSERSDQHQWWMETSKLFTGDVTFHDCTVIEPFGAGGTDDAGFVQVMEAQVTDVPRLRELGREMDALGNLGRPDVIGGIVAIHPDNAAMTMAVYFTDEASAREGEQREAPPQVRSLMDQQAQLMSDITYFDLREPWLLSPR